MGLELLKTREQDINTLLKNKDRGDFVFTAKHTGTRLHRVGYPNPWIQSYFEESELSKKLTNSYHSFRATLITDLLISGVPIETVKKKIVGHRDIKATHIYHMLDLLQNITWIRFHKAGGYVPYFWVFLQLLHVIFLKIILSGRLCWLTARGRV